MNSIPIEFLQRAQKFVGDEHEAFLRSLSDPSPVSIRVNPGKRSGQFEDNERIPWSAEGRYLDERPSFTFDPLFHAGCYYVQEASSQFLEVAFNQARKELGNGIKILDLCAAPGGKSTHLLSLMNDGDLLVSNEVVASRNKILRQNIQKWGKANAVVTQSDPSHFESLAGFFDIVVVDAPCSGEGMFRKEEEAITQWSPELVASCSRRQSDILPHACKALRHGGILMYSTCTFESAENDDQIKGLIEEYAMESIPVSYDDDRIVEKQFGKMFFPHRVKGEGFYQAMLRKNSEEKSNRRAPALKEDKKNRAWLEKYLKSDKSYYSFRSENNLFAIPGIHVDAIGELADKLYIRQSGIEMGELKGDTLIPSPALALSLQLRDDVPSIEFSEAEAIKFLQGETLPPNPGNDWYVAKHKGFALGWLKHAGSRSNNYYPKEWRIRNKVKIKK